ncbi:MAG: glycoside hydrolase family 38 C-terminal domain-containing protein, partial [Promethearchaeota archaeon]
IAGVDYSGFLKRAWLWLLKNQPHDSSWTASWDQVIKEMEIRFDWAKQIAEETRNWAFLDITSRIKIEKQNPKQVEIVIFNPLEFNRIEPIQVIIPTNFKLEEGYSLLSSNGKPLISDFKQRKVSKEELFQTRKFVGSHGPRPRYFYDLFVEPIEVPAIGYTTIFLFPANQEDQQKLNEQNLKNSKQFVLKASDSTLENAIIKVEIHSNGTFKLVDKISGHEYDNINLFVDVGDVGDGYEFIPISGDIPITTNACKAKRSLILQTDFMAMTKTEITLDIPSSATPDYNGRSDSTIPTLISVYLTVFAGSCPRVDVHVEFENKSKDHRLSVVFPTGLNASKVNVDGHFAVIERDIELPKNTEKWVVKPTYQAPQHRFISITDAEGNKGILIANRGLPEYEAIPSEDGTINLGLTLLRANSRWGVHIRRDNPIILNRTQVLVKHEFDYSIIPHQGNLFDKAFRAACSFRYPLFSTFKGPHNMFMGYHRIDKPDTYLPAKQSFFKIDNPLLVISTIKKAESSDDIILRIFNASIHSKAAGILETALNVKRIELVNLNEEVIQDHSVEIEHDLKSIKLDMPPAKIATLKLVVE